MKMMTGGHSTTRNETKDINRKNGRGGGGSSPRIDNESDRAMRVSECVVFALLRTRKKYHVV